MWQAPRAPSAGACPAACAPAPAEGRAAGARSAGAGLVADQRAAPLQASAARLPGSGDSSWRCVG
eukprot:10448637-Lingulodinium_polyedra.AAC.1